MTVIPGLRLSQLLRLAYSDLWRERWIGVAAACVVAATLGPLWTLLGLQRGAIDAVIDRMERDPRMLLVDSEGATTDALAPAWFEELARWPQVSFVTPKTRDIANAVTLYRPGGARPVDVTLVPSGAGDPVLGRAEPPTGAAVVLTQAAAQALGARIGDSLLMQLTRELDGRREAVAVPLRLQSVLPADADGTKSARASLGLLLAILDWRDGVAEPQWSSLDVAPAQPRSYKRFRAYAKSIHVVGALVERLQAQGLAVRWQSAEIASALGMQRNLRAIFALIAVVGIVGATVSLAALQVANINRKRREFALLKLLGHGRSWLMSIPVMQAGSIALVGAALAYGLYAVARIAIGAWYGQHLLAGGAVVRLSSVDLLGGVLGASIVSGLPALWAGWRMSCLEAADELRDI
ncbi:MAG: ABC transporter permease [Burkholderiaceae bacterium]